MRSRSENGKYGREYDDSAFLDALEEVGEGYASDVAEIVGATYRTTLTRLNELHERGEVERRVIGDRYVFTVKGERALEEGSA
jgi:DNA-binding IclR family transcriptional regulator